MKKLLKKHTETKKGLNTSFVDSHGKKYSRSELLKSKNLQQTYNVHKICGMKAIFDQNIGIELSEKVIADFENTRQKIILNFQGVESINVASWNAFLSNLVSRYGKKDLNNYFSVKNGNNTIKNTLAISLQLMKYMEDEE